MRIAGSTFIYLTETDSTNLYASRLLAEGNPPDGTLILAAQQTAGRGSRGKVWTSKRNDAILMSLIRYPSGLSAAHAHRYSLATGMAVIAAIRRLDPALKVQLKWPNDVLIDARKVCGILIESHLRGSMLVSMITGIGINYSSAPHITDYPAASLADFINDLPDMQHFVRETLCRELDAVHLQMQGHGWMSIADSINACLFRKNELLRFADKTEHGIRKGVIRGIDADGKLVIECGKQPVAYSREEVEVAWF